ncbi:MAG: PEGA domain-containing protein [Parcubacteria group bacterium]|nr:PEGA domain-containing protein [Parcubacteria group bacterium]
MTIRFRRFVFWIFVILFIAASITITLFAQGWRFDFDSFKMVRTGGIFVKTTVSGAKIYINDKFTGTTAGILNYTKLVDDLAPKNYNLFIHKEGYYPWNKMVEVKNGLVTKLISVTLFPLELKKIKMAQLPAQKIADFEVNDKTIRIIDNKKIGTAKIYDFDGQFISNEKFKISTSTELISPDKNKKLYAVDNKIWIEYLNDIKEEPSKKAGEKEIIATSESPILFLDWLKDSEHIIWLTNGELTIAERDNRGGKRNSVKFYLNINPPIFWDIKNFDLYFFETDKSRRLDGTSTVGIPTEASGEKIILYKINVE